MASGAKARLRVILFPGGAQVPMWVAEDRGLFARHALSVELTPTPSSVFLAEAMARGEYDIALATFDNVVGYVEGQGEVALPEPPDFAAFLSIMHGTVHLMAQPAFGSITDLKGKALGVDAVATGYSLALMQLLEAGGLAPGDYTLEPIGNTAERQKLLLENRTPATILTTPLHLLPMSRGYRELADFGAMVGPYQAIAAFARRAWMREHAAALSSFIAATTAALDWLMDPAWRADAVALYRRHLPHLPEAAATAALAAMTADEDGFSRGGRFDHAGIANVLAIRSRFGRPARTLADPTRYVDESWLREVGPAYSRESRARQSGAPPRGMS